MAIAAEIGFRMATRGSMRLRLNSTASMASGMPWPLIFGRSIFRHETDDEAADDRNQNYPPAEMVIPRADELGRKAVIEDKVGEESDQLVQRKGDEAGEKSDSACQKRNQHHAKLGRLGKPDVSDLRPGGSERGGSGWSARGLVQLVLRLVAGALRRSTPLIRRRGSMARLRAAIRAGPWVRSSRR